jgi:hypothetical protein
MSTYTYHKLDPTSREIRLIKIVPSNTTEAFENGRPVECSMCCASLDSPPSYVALSYVWGDPARKKDLNIDGKIVRITESLDTALRHLRSFGGNITSRPLWIDALCINQDDNDEKSCQVGQMRDIYRKCFNTIVWLGPATEERNIAMDQIHRLGKYVSEMHRSMPWEAAVASIMDKPDFPIAKVIAFFRNPWWVRVWVVQEFVVSKVVWFVCGRKPVPGGYVMLAMIELGKRITQNNAAETAPSFHRTDYEDPKINPSMPDLPVIFTITPGSQRGDEGPSLLWLLITSVECGLQASDQRDRIFALLGLSRDAREMGITANYSMSYSQVLTSLTMAMLRHGHFMILSMCRHAKPEVNIPSWVPDWSSMRIHRGRTMYRESDEKNKRDPPLFSAGGASTAVLTFRYVKAASPLLQISGWRFDSIFVTHPCPRWLDSLKSLDRRELLGLFLTMLEFLKLRRHVYAGSEEEAAWRTIILDVEKDPQTRRLRRATELYHREYRTYVNGLMQAVITGDFSSFRIRYLMQEVVDCTEGRNPFLTSSGYLGLGPSGLKPNDLVVVFLGVETPFVLRASGEGQYKLLGEAYVHGIMDGEFTKSISDKEIFEIC